MGSRTKFQDVRAALKTAFTTQLAADAVTAEVTAHIPIGNVTMEDRVYLGDISFSQEPYTFDVYQETIEVDLFVECPTSGGGNDELDESEARAETIFDSILKKLRTDITVGSTVFNVELGQTESSTGPITDQWVGCRIEAALLVEAHVNA